MTQKAVAFLATTRPEESRRFYTEVLGLRLLEEHEFALVFEVHGALLRVQKTAQVIVVPYTAFGIEVDDIEAAVDELARRGVSGLRFPQIEQDERGIWLAPGGTRVFWFSDPDGQRLSLSQPPAAHAAAASEPCLRVIGHVRSALTLRESAPKQGHEGAPEAWLELEPSVVEGLSGIGVGQALVLLTWLHDAQRDVLRTHPRDDRTRPLAGVFATRSPDRPNPIGLHRVRVLAVAGNRVRVEPLEAIDGTPILDLKPALDEVVDA